MHAQLPAAPDLLRRHALLLDIDGTLLDIAPRPDAVRVPPGLPGLLKSLHAQLGGGLALVTGRPLEQARALLGPLPTAAEHGAVLHIPPAPPRRLALPRVPYAWQQATTTLLHAHPGTLLELKHGGFVLHYRGAPDAGPALETALRPLLATDPRFELLPAAMAWEIRPAGADKGRALRALMAVPGFAGRLPLFIGDDVTDLAAIDAARALGGIGLHMADSFGTPGRLRQWLMTLQENAPWLAS